MKVGDRLLIQYKKYDDDKPAPSGSYPITVKEGQMYKAYLGMKKEDENAAEVEGLVVYSPQAARGRAQHIDPGPGRQYREARAWPPGGGPDRQADRQVTRAGNHRSR